MSFSFYIGFETQEPDENQGGRIVTWHRYAPEFQDIDIPGVGSRTVNHILNMGSLEWPKNGCENGTVPLENAMEAVQMLRLPVPWLSPEDNAMWARYADRLEEMVEIIKLHSTPERTLEIYWT